MLAPLLLAFLAYAGEQGSEPIDPHGKLQVVCPGNIKVRGSSGSNLTYRLRAPGRVTFTRQGRQAILQAQDIASLDLTTPKTLELLTITTRGGDLDVADLSGSFFGQAAGRVTIARVAGNVELHSAGGPASFTTIGGLLKFSTGGGSITGESLGGDAILETGGGDIIVHRASGQIRAYTGGGAIHIVHATGLVTAKNSGGPIQLSSVTGPVQAATLAGSIIAQFLPGFAIMDSFLSTAAGDITVIMASNVHVNVRAQNESSMDLRSIVSDFPALRLWSARSGVFAEGAINGGGPLLRIADTGGAIYIRKK